MRPHGSFTPRLTANGSFTPRLSPTAARAKEQREIEEAAADTADRWLLSADQRARVHALFARIDVNHDGVISMGEMTAYMHGDKRQALELLFEMDRYQGCVVCVVTAVKPLSMVIHNIDPEFIRRFKFLLHSSAADRPRRIPQTEARASTVAQGMECCIHQGYMHVS